MELFERVENLLKIKSESRYSLAKKLSIAQTTFNGYFDHERQGKLAPHLWTILKLFPDVRRDWLFFGEGEMLKSDEPNIEAAPTVQPASQPTIVMQPQAQPVPLIGFAACSVMGWHGAMTIPVPVEPPTWHPDMFAVMASGESMLPAGIGHGHICYCDPTKVPGPDEAVYVETKDNLGTIKLFCGRSDVGGAETIKLRGWLDIDPETGTQKPTGLEIVAHYVRKIAPVMYVRRRL